MTRAKWGKNLVYEDSTGRMYAVKNEADLDARLVQDILVSTLRNEPVDTENWLLRFVERSDPDFKAVIDAAIERVRRYIHPKKNHVEIMWEKHVIPEELADRVMGFLAKENVFIKPPPFIDHGPQK